MKKSIRKIERRTCGRDSYIVDNMGDIVVENAGEGVDHVQAGVSYTLSDNVEKQALKQTTKTLQPGSANDDNYEDRRTA